MRDLKGVGTLLFRLSQFFSIMDQARVFHTSSFLGYNPPVFLDWRNQRYYFLPGAFSRVAFHLCLHGPAVIVVIKYHCS